MHDHGSYPTRTGAEVTARMFTAELPPGAGDVRFYVEAVDGRGNRSVGTLERVFLR